MGNPGNGRSPEVHGSPHRGQPECAGPLQQVNTERGASTATSGAEVLYLLLVIYCCGANDPQWSAWKLQAVVSFPWLM